jgi:hypothetical protein
VEIIELLETGSHKIVKNLQDSRQVGRGQDKIPQSNIMGK